jgi:hypothetical protein
MGTGTTSFTVEANVPPGTYYVTVLREDGATTSRDYNVSYGQTVTLQFYSGMYGSPSYFM